MGMPTTSRTARVELGTGTYGLSMGAVPIRKSNLAHSKMAYVIWPELVFCGYQNWNITAARQRSCWTDARTRGDPSASPWVR
ncbi:hypothetical protein ACVWYO_003482 [Sphingomonas sp. UYP23]